MSDSIDKNAEQQKLELEKQKTVKNQEDQNIEAKKKEQDASLQNAMNDYKSDMFKYKERAKIAEAEAQKLKDEKAAKDKVNLEKNEEWKKLYIAEKKEKEDAANALQKKSEQFLDSSKINAVVQQLGGFKKNEYSKFIEAKNIELNENGTIDDASLLKEVDRIKQTFPELLKTEKAPAMPNDAAANFEGNGQKELKAMSSQELLAEYTRVNK